MRCIGIFVFLFLLLSPVVGFAAEKIDVFKSDITVQADGTFLITENITYDFGEEQRHGIFRFIPSEYPIESESAFKEHYVDIDFSSITVDGNSVPYDVTDDGESITVKIGDPDITITGTHVYTISYIVKGGLIYPGEDTVELYWNVTGTEWEVPIKQAQVSISGNMSGVLGEAFDCYAGSSAGLAKCDAKSSENETTIFTQNNILPGSGLTVAQSLNSEVVGHLILERWNLLFILPILIFAWFVFLGISVYRYRIFYKFKAPIIAQYEPYENYKPMYTGLLFDGKLHPQDITACIIYLAEQGYIKIKKTNSKVLFLFEVDDYEVTLVKTPDANLSQFQKEILLLLFDSLTTVGATTSLSKLKADTSKQTENQNLLVELRKNLESDLQKEGFFQKNRAMLYRIVGASLVAALPIFWFHVYVQPLGAYFILIGVAFIASAGIAFLYRRRTRKGYEALYYLEGFKQFLSVTEKERYAFHNAPEKSPEQFMAYLPYAIAFGVEKKWATVFKDITIPNPDWYEGGTMQAFAATNLTTSLGAFSTAFTASSSSSASSGGGSVGGGTGGGGGGSW